MAGAIHEGNMKRPTIEQVNAVIFEFSALAAHVDPDIYQRFKIDPHSENADNDVMRTITTHFQIFRAWCSVNNEKAMMGKIDNLIRKNKTS